MKVRFGMWNTQKFRKNRLPQHSSGTVKFAVRYGLAVRLLTVMLITGLLIPLVFFGQTSKTSVQNSSSGNQLSTSVFASAESVISSTLGSFGSLVDPALSSAASVNQSVANGYQAVSDYLTIPTPPEGFAQAKVPTLWGKISTDLSSIAASVVSPFATTSASATAPAPGVGKFDFDGDNKADAARWQASTGEWKVRNSSNGSFSTITTGISSTMIIAPADYNGDGKTDYAVLNYATGTWTIKHSSGGTTQTITGLGQSGDKVVSGKYDSDSSADAAVFRPSNGTWYVKQSTTGTIVSTAFGASTDIPTPGDYDGDALMDFAVFRPSDGGFYVKYSSNGSVIFFQWGISTDTPVPGNYDNDSKTDFAVYRPSTGIWYINKSDGYPYIAKTWGNYGDQPVPADYDNDGKDDLAVWRATTGVWYIVKSSDATLNTYEYQTLGVAGDVPVPSAHVKQIGGPVPTYGMAKARLSPRNATGGTDLYSQNFSWGTSLVGLPGRAGLDAGFGISYNSLIWTKQFGYMIFDADNSNVSPGFRFGFPVIEPSYFDDQTGKFAYLMVTPSGGRVEFRQDAATGIYETADSTYTQLSVTAPLIGGGGGHPSTATEDLTLTLTGTNGAQMTYVWKAGAFRCSQIKDRNGNFITINHDAYGLLTSVTDTLGRVIIVEYDTQKYPVAIKQTRRTNNGDATGTDVVQSLVTFTYKNITINTNFGSLGVYGPPNGTTLKVLEKITSATGNSTSFDYNPYGQVRKITNKAASGSVLNYTEVNLPNDTTSVQSDCPRFTKTTNKYEPTSNAAGFETIVNNLFEENKTCYVAGLNLPATIIETSLENHPNNLVSKSCHFPVGNWTEGLPYATEDIADGVQKRWTVTSWTQDNTNLNYILNPRVEESKVGDTTNVKRTTIEYLEQPGTNASIYGLVSAVRVYKGNESTPLKKSLTEYNRSAAYESRRIIGLPSKSELFEGESQLMAQTTYLYDEGSLTGDGQDISPIQHDNTNYGSGFNIGRGNPTSAVRHEVPSNATTIISSIKYDTAGSPISQTDPMGREVKISYADSFNDGGNGRNTYAYPTKLTEVASPFTNNFSTIKYRYDIGANIHAKSPVMPTSPTNLSGEGKETKRFFDLYGRLERESIIKNNAEFAYTRYDFTQSDRDVHSKVFSTITDTNNNGIGDGADEVLSEAFTDAAGRVVRTRKPISFGTGGTVTTWAGQKIEYDILGRVTQQSVPAEVDANWALAGDDDATRGTWLWTRQKYDWKGRVIRKINTDGADSTTLNASDVLINYEGCGCAGGQETTVQGELVPRDDQPNALARRMQKIYEDVLGRTWKTVEMKWDGTTPYKTTITALNGRDQATSITETDNVNSISQVTTMTYDGFGRLKTARRPQQTADTIYEYKPDGQLYWMTDARNAKTTYAYNSRGLVNSISYSAPTGSNITVPGTITFDYNALGNRIKMEDGLGEVNYEYNQFSQITAEVREFDDSLPNAPMSGNKFRLEYTYGISGQLTSYKDPYDKQIIYAQDKIGRLNSVTGTSFGGVTNYASNPTYRAWGALKSLTYGNSTQTQTQMQMTYDNHLQAATYQLTNQSQSIMKKNYDYYADGSLKYVEDELNPKFDRLNTYDYTGRIKEGKSAAEARGIPVTQNLRTELPYRQSYAFDAFGNMSQRNNLHWGTGSWQGRSLNLNYSYQNNRITNLGWQHDADGRVTVSAAPDKPMNSFYDAAGQLITIRYPQSIGAATTNRHQDGDGREGKRETGTCFSYGQSNSCQTWDTNLETRYYIRSSVFDKEVVSEAFSDGRKRKTFVMAAGAKIAEQIGADPTNGVVDDVYFKHWDASGMSQRTSYSDGNFIEDEDLDISPVESDALGGNAGITTPYNRPRPMGPQNPDGIPRGPRDSGEGEPNYVSGQPTVLLDGYETSHAVLMALASANALGVKADMGNGKSIGIRAQESFGGLSYISSVSVTRRETKDPGFFHSPSVSIQYSWVNLSASPRQQNLPSPLPPPLPPPEPDLGKLRDAFKQCAKDKFGVELLDGSTWSQKGVDGELKFNVLPGTTVNVYGGNPLSPTPAKSFSIYNSTARLSSGKLGGDLGMAPGPESGITGDWYGIYQTNNSTVGTIFTNRNFTASDIDVQFNLGNKSQSQKTTALGLGIDPFMDGQIHEAGNTLCTLTGKCPLPDSGDDLDPGQVMSDCVYPAYRALLKN